MTVESDNSIESLTARLLEGRALFFVGSGFSLDSEPNTVGRMIERLRARLEQLEKSIEIHKFSADLGCKFDVKRLSERYYEVNTWFIAAFASLLKQISENQSRKQVDVLFRRQLLMENGEKIRRIERAYIDTKDNPDLDEWRRRGKALFLDTIGFRCPKVFAGNVYQDFSVAIDEFTKDEIRDRHRALARWAREGYFSTLLTTNFDLLLEGALRETGLQLRCPSGEKVGEDWAPCRVQQFAIITSGGEFLKIGHGNKTIRLVKIHGCLDVYRRRRKTWKQRRNYIDSIVFAYREIQHWRRDAWARDLVRGLQRTHSIAFLGYSTADPIMHATFREVYDEMARWTERDPGGPEADRPAFYFSHEAKRPFHAVEILEAADRAAGHPDPRREDHENFLDFYSPRDPEAEFEKEPDDFPNQDQALQWINHLAYRNQQLLALRRGLKRMLLEILGDRRPASQIQRVAEDFENLLELETDAISDVSSQTDDRFDEIVGWTWTFHPAALRAMVCTEIEDVEKLSPKLQRSWHGDSGMLMRAYCPANDYPVWLAWSTIVELALRRLAALRMGLKPGDGLVFRSGELRFQSEARPRGVRLDFCRFKKRPSARSLHLSWEPKGLERGRPPSKHRKRNVKRWMIGGRPWAQPKMRRPVFRAASDSSPAPKVEKIWRWAAGELDEAEAGKWT